MILLDTSVLIWLIDDDSRLGPHARRILESHHPVYYSSVSVLEMMIKQMKGRLVMPPEICRHLDGEGLRQLPLAGEHAEALDEFPRLFGHDPFDRALLAQAVTEGHIFLTVDRLLLALEHDWIVDARV